MEEPPEQPTGSSEQREQPRLEVWLVDDDAGTQRSYVRVMASARPDVILRTFSKAEDAFVELEQRIAQGQTLPHGMLIDGNLNADRSEFDKGSKFVYMIREAVPEREKIFIIAHSSDPEENEEMISAGANAELEKPMSERGGLAKAVAEIERYQKKT